MSYVPALPTSDILAEPRLDRADRGVSTPGSASLEQHFRLRRPPFPQVADPDLLFMGRPHKEALAHLLYGLRTEGGILLLTGDIGTGKTSICRSFLDELPDEVKAAHIAHPAPDVHALMVSVCRGFGLKVADDTPMRQLIELLNAFLLDHHARGRRAMLLIDDAQRLTPDVLEQLRLLTNLETHATKLLQIVLVGQTGLRDLLGRPELRQLSQRVVARYHLGALGRDEVMPYVHHALRVAGGAPVLMPRRLAWSLYGWTAGVPRSINQLCERAMQLAAGHGKAVVERRLLSAAARDLGLAPAATPWPWNHQLAGVSLTLVMACAAAVTWAPHQDSGIPEVPATPSDLSAASRLAAVGTVGAGPGSGNDAKTSTEGPAATAMPATSAEPGTVAAAVAPGATTSGGTPPVQRSVDGIAMMSSLPPANGAPDTRPAQGTGTLPAMASGWPSDTGQSMSGGTGTGSTASGTAIAAWTALMQRWNGPSASWRGCAAAARSAQLQCLEGRAGLAELRELNLPAVLHLVDGSGRRGDVLLHAIDDQSVVLRIGDSDRRISLTDLALRWRGDYTVLWRSPPSFAQPLRQGTSGQDVVWLRDRLAQLPSGLVRPHGRLAFDTQLQARLREFQLQEHLDPDGIAGIKTLVRLAQRTDPAHPVLDRSSPLSASSPSSASVSTRIAQTAGRS